MTDETQRTPNISETLRLTVDSALNDVHTSIPGVVVAYDKATQRAQVQATVMKSRLLEDGSRAVEKYPLVVGCPVQFPGGSGLVVTFPVRPGDFGMLMFSEASIDRWIVNDGRIVDPDFDHRFDLTDGWFIPGIRPAKAARQTQPDDAVCIGVDGGDFQGAALGATLQTFLNGLRAALVGHTHPYVNVATPAITGPGTFATPTLPTVPDVESDTVKITV